MPASRRKQRWRGPLEHTGTRQSYGRGRGRRVNPGPGVPSTPAKRTRVTCRRAGVSPRVPGGLTRRGSPSPGGERPRRPPLAVPARLSKRAASHRLVTHSHRFAIGFQEAE
ncbi:hypothetical protein PVAP13_7KG408466 [Panicum virgatum]|uniref:Uncharacterized protein n=1 Tax=Panicum virgatum TaxID=38727 RepID=A0A8T0QPT6_PANVG|nr:hypothetical protein PVAP13_7KG408466 [Panicum virgatum]